MNLHLFPATWSPWQTLPVVLFVAAACAADGARAGEVGSPAPAARRYHDATEHSPQSIRTSGHRLAWENKPALYRSYAGAETVPLPPPRRLDLPALAAIAPSQRGSAKETEALDLETLSTVLYLSGGIVGKRPTSGGDIRATAAAGALYPNETYVVAGGVSDLAPGVYHHDAKRERLARLRRGDWRGPLAAAAADARVRSAPATLVITGILWRTAWKYRERGYRHLYWDGGMRLAHVLAAAAAARLPAAALAGFIDRDVDRIVGINGRSEMSLALVSLGTAAAGGEKDPAANAEGREVPPVPYKPTVLSLAPVDYPEALRYHAASRLADADAVRRFRAGKVVREGRDSPNEEATVVSLPTAAPARGDPSLDSVVRRRRSTRRFARRPISADDLAAVLMPSSGSFPADFLATQRGLIETYVIVHAVEGIAAGSYYFDRASRRLRHLRSGDFRATSGFLGLGQALPRDASAVFFYLADLEAIFRAFGERGYRLAELEAGLIAGRAYLSTYAVGRGGTGLTFFDDLVTEFFSPHAKGLEPLLVYAVGVPAKR